MRRKGAGRTSGYVAGGGLGEEAGGGGGGGGGGRGEGGAGDDRGGEDMRRISCINTNFDIIYKVNRMQKKHY